MTEEQFADKEYHRKFFEDMMGRPPTENELNMIMTMLENQDKYLNEQNEKDK